MSRIANAFRLAAIVVLVGGFIPLLTLGADADARLVVPDAASRAAAMKVAQEAFSADLRVARSPAERSAVAKKILRTAEDSKALAADWYVLLDLARTTAATAPDAETALMAIARMQAAFVVDGIALRGETMTTLAAVTRTPEDRTAFLAAAQDAVTQSILVDRYEVASSVGKLGLAEARKSGSNAAIKNWQALNARIESLGKAYVKVATASKILEQKPDDPAANFTVGVFLCFDKGQWKAGLPLLVRGSDADLHDLASRDLAGASDANAQSAMGDAWWDLATKRSAGVAEIKRRAAFWYQQAEPGLLGLARAKVDKRLKEALEEPIQANGIERLASLRFVEDMGYTVSELRMGTSTHNNDNYPLTDVPAALVGKQFTQMVGGKNGSVSFEFATRGKIFILAQTWSGYPPQAEILKRVAKKEAMHAVGGTITFEVWSIAGEAGKRVDLPFQDILVAESLEKVATLR